MSRRDDPVRRAAVAHTNLTVLASVVSILEGGNIYGGCARTQRVVSKIIRLSQDEQSKLVREYDAARSEAYFSPPAQDGKGGER